MKPVKRRRDQNSANIRKTSLGSTPLSITLKWQRTLLLITSILFVYFFSSCTPQACIDETNAFVKVSFYATAKRVAPDSLTIFGLGMDSTRLYNNEANIQPALLPLNTNTGDCVFIIIINGITDTMSLTYNSFPYLISKECGYSFYHTIVTQPVVTKNIIDSVRVLNGNITTKNEENLRIYY